jgi:hypothetical protein
LFSIDFIIFVEPIDFGPQGEAEAPELKHFPFKGSIRSRDYFDLFQLCPALPGSTKMPARYRAPPECFDYCPTTAAFRI